MEIKEYIQKYGRKLIDTSWGILPAWEIKLLLDNEAVKIKNGQASVVLEPLGYIKDKTHSVVQKLYGEPDLIRSQFSDYKNNNKGFFYLDIVNCPLTYNRIMTEIQIYKDQIYKDSLKGLDDKSLEQSEVPLNTEQVLELLK